MSTVTAGNPVTLDALFAQESQPSPDAVTFNVTLPDDTAVSYVFGVDAEVTNPSSDYYECAIGVPSEVGEYRWNAVATAGSSGEVSQTIYGTVFVLQSANAPEVSTPPGPMLGPCSTWITGEDVAECVTWDDWGSDPSVFDVVAWEASMALYEISGRRFAGLCESVGRPCAMNCPCNWAPASYGASPFWWTGSSWAVGAGNAWYNERAGVAIGCNPVSKVRLPYPTREIVEVKIGGVIVPEFNADDGWRQWRLDGWRYLIRMNQPGNPITPLFWPGCQDMSLDADQPNTFEVTYKWGITPPELGRRASVELAVQLALACGNGENCVLPAGVTKVKRQGIEIERGLLANWLDPTQETGLVQLDLFLQAYAGGQRRGRRSAVYSPDLQQFPRVVGTGSQYPGT